MRCKSLIALAAVSAALVGANQSAFAFGLREPDLRDHPPYEHKRPDPYAYFYDPRGWYPYYNSNEWGPRKISRFNGELPPYYGAWGANKDDYYHVEWHRQHYGGHRRGDW